MKCECNYHLGMGPNLLCPMHGKREDLDRYKRKLVKALKLYADPGFYHGCSFAFDRPTGGFDEDFSENNMYDYEKPGKLARSIIGELEV